MLRFAPLLFVAGCATATTIPTAPAPEPAPAPASAPEPEPAPESEPAPAPAPAPAPEPAPAPAPAPAPEPAPAPDDSRRGTRVLHVGDSFVLAGLSQALRPRLREIGAHYEVIARTSAYTTSFGGDPDLEKALARRPDLVLVTLGANEFEAPPGTHAAAIRAFARRLGKVATCVWVAPPSWKKDAGILATIRENAAPCLYFDSDAAVGDVPRQRDGIHPNPEGGARWADALWRWLEQRRVPGARWRLDAGAVTSPRP